MPETQHPNDTNQAHYLTRPVGNVMEAGKDVHDSALDWSLAYVVSGHLECDHEWARRFIDIVDVLSVTVDREGMCGLGALYWAPDDAIGSHEAPDPLTFEIRYDPQSADLVSWYEVIVWSQSGCIRLTPEGARRLSRASDSKALLPAAAFLAVTSDSEAPFQSRLAAAHMVSSRGEEGPTAVKVVLDQLAEEDAEGRQACLTGIQRACWDTGHLDDAVLSALDSFDPAVRANAAVTIWTTEADAALRARALPALLSALRESHSLGFTTARGTVIVGGHYGIGAIAQRVLTDAAKEENDIVDRLIEALGDPASVSGAIGALQLVGPPARSAVGPLCDIAKQYPKCTSAVWQSLCAISEDHAHDIASDLFSEDEDKRSYAVDMLYKAEPYTARWVAPELIKALESATFVGRDRYRIACTLAAVTPRDEAVRAALRRLLPELAAAFAEDGVGDVYWADSVLTAIGSDAADVVPVLVQRAGERGKVGESAIRVLGAIGPAAADAVPTLVAIFGSLEEEDSQRAYLAAKALVAIGTAAVHHMVLFLEWEDSESEFGDYLARRAGNVLRDIGEGAAPIVCEMFSRDPESLLVVRALGWVGPLAIPQLLQALASGEAAVRLEAACGLGRIGPDAGMATGQLAGLLGDAHEDVAIAAARALGRIGPAAASSLRTALTQDLPETVRAWVLRFLGEMGL